MKTHSYPHPQTRYDSILNAKQNYQSLSLSDGTYNLIYHSGLFIKTNSYTLYIIFSSGLQRYILTKVGRYTVFSKITI